MKPLCDLLYVCAFSLSLLIAFLLSRGSGRDTPARDGASFVVQALWLGLVMASGARATGDGLLAFEWGSFLLLFAFPLFFLAFSLDVAERRDAFAEPWFYALCLPALAFLAYLPFDGGRSLVRADLLLGAPKPSPFGPLAFAAFAYASAVGLAAFFPLVRRIRSPRAHPRSTLAILAAAGALFSCGAVSAFSFALAPAARWLMPLFFAGGDLLVLAALIAKGRQCWLPLSREEAFRELPEAALLFDRSGTLVDANLAARYLLDLPRPSLWPAEGRLLLSRFPGLEAAMGEACGNVSASLDLQGQARDYRIEASPFLRGERREGTLVVFHDETSSTKSRRALRTMRDSLETMYRSQMRNLAEEVERRRDAEDLLRNMNEELKNTQKEIMMTLSNIVENRAKETAQHAQRVAEYSYVLARTMGVEEERAKIIRDAAPLHDVGKIAIRDNILEKPGALDDEEWILMRTHPRVGYELLRGSKRELLRVAATIALEHHERWDGSGYPQGLKGEQISLEGRITAMADVIDALYSRRGYKEPWEFDRITEYIRTEAGGHFDPALVRAYEECYPQILAVAATYDDSSRVPSEATRLMRESLAKQSARRDALAKRREGE